MFTSVSRTMLRKSLMSKKLMALPMRGLKLHEYQAAQLLKSFDVPVPFVSRLASIDISKHIKFRVKLHSVQKKQKQQLINSRRVVDQAM